MVYNDLLLYPNAVKLIPKNVKKIYCAGVNPMHGVLEEAFIMDKIHVPSERFNHHLSNWKSEWISISSK